MADVNRIRAFLRLTLADGVGAVTFRNIVQKFGDVTEAPVLSPDLLQMVKGVGEKTARAIVDLDEKLIDEELAEVERRNVKILCMEDADFPAALRNLHDCPPLLYVRGELRKTDAIAIGVVGSRRCTHYGMEQAERFGSLLGRAGFAIISGGARGIDTAAHRGAMQAGGRTVAVMGCGLCTAYPPENAGLFEEIAAGNGALVSELPMRTAVLGGNFPT
ncbi:MAG: DNA-processing protein DprA, partial [Planctomycetaceae bacterium]